MTAFLGSRTPATPGSPETPHVAIALKDTAATVDRLSKALQYDTTSSPSAANHVTDPKQFVGLHAHLKASFPLVWKRLSVETVSVKKLPSTLQQPE